MRHVPLIAFALASIASAQTTLLYRGTHTGRINGGTLGATVNATMSNTTGAVSGTIAISKRPPNFHLAASGLSLICISCSNGGKSKDNARNFSELLGGAGSYTHTRTYRYGGAPRASLSVSGRFQLRSGVLTYSGTWRGTTTGVPTDLVDVSGYKQVLSNAGPGRIAVEGEATLARKSGAPVPIHWTGLYTFSKPIRLPGKSLGEVDLDFKETSTNNFQVTGKSLVALALDTDTRTISLSKGGSQKFTLEAPQTMAGGIYLVAGSLGSSPGITLNGVSIPLNPDPYLSLSIANANSSTFVNTRGKLDANGRATARFVLPRNTPPSLAGLTLFHAFVVDTPANGLSFASDAAPLTLVR